MAKPQWKYGVEISPGRFDFTNEEKIKRKVTFNNGPVKEVIQDTANLYPMRDISICGGDSPGETVLTFTEGGYFKTRFSSNFDIGYFEVEK